MRKGILLLGLLFQLTSLNAQSLLTKFMKLSRPEKCWTILHPFVCKKAFQATLQSQTVTDSIKKSGIIGTDNSGGKLDAFKHTYWMAVVAKVIGPRKALKLGKAHERGNKLQFKKHQKEDRILPDSVSSCMDLHNNEQGVLLVKKNRQATQQDLQKEVLHLLRQGELACIRKDKNGNFLTCKGTVIDMKKWTGKWNIPKCIIASDTN
ncbi:MAG TPA: hypothetical protein VLB84_10085 [Bacteroidia bacterium]|nr:hypothetical protein [Bacteroidia bacterium]